MFAKCIEATDEEDCEIKMSNLFGKFLFNLPLEKQRKQYAKSFISFYDNIRKSLKPDIRMNAAYNLPCFFYYFGNYDD